MGISRGKQFEYLIKEQFEKVPNCSVDRIHDQTSGYSGSTNICDLIVYKHPYQYYFECKAIIGNTLNFKSHIRQNQWDGLLEKSKIKGVHAGIICWFIDKDLTVFIPVQILEMLKEEGNKSFNISKDFDYHYHNGVEFFEIIEIQGKKRRVFFEYDLEQFLKGVD